MTREITTADIVIWDYQTGERLQVLGSHESFPRMLSSIERHSVFSSGLEAI